MLRSVHRSSSNNFMKCQRGVIFRLNFYPKSIRKIYPQNLSAKFIRKIYPQNLYPQNLSAKFIRNFYPQNLSPKSTRKIYPQFLSAKFIRNPYPHFLPDLHKVFIALFVEYSLCCLLCHNLHLHMLKTCSIGKTVLSVSCARFKSHICKLSPPHLKTKKSLHLPLPEP